MSSIPLSTRAVRALLCLLLAAATVLLTTATAHAQVKKAPVDLEDCTSAHPCDDGNGTTYYYTDNGDGTYTITVTHQDGTTSSYPYSEEVVVVNDSSSDDTGEAGIPDYNDAADPTAGGNTDGGNTEEENTVAQAADDFKACKEAAQARLDASDGKIDPQVAQENYKQSLAACHSIYCAKLAELRKAREEVDQNFNNALLATTAAASLGIFAGPTAAGTTTIETPWVIETLAKAASYLGAIGLGTTATYPDDAQANTGGGGGGPLIISTITQYHDYRNIIFADIEKQVKIKGLSASRDQLHVVAQRFMDDSVQAGEVILTGEAKTLHEHYMKLLSDDDSEDELPHEDPDGDNCPND